MEGLNVTVEKLEIHSLEMASMPYRFAEFNFEIWFELARYVDNMMSNVILTLFYVQMMLQH